MAAVPVMMFVDAWRVGDGEGLDDAIVTIEGGMVTFTGRDNEELQIIFDREEWESLRDFIFGQYKAIDEEARRLEAQERASKTTTVEYVAASDYVTEAIEEVRRGRKGD